MTQSSLESWAGLACSPRLTLLTTGRVRKLPTWLLVTEGVGRERSADRRPTDKQRVTTDTEGAEPGNRPGLLESEAEDGLKQLWTA